MSHCNKHMISFFMTTKCNLCCRYCYNAQERNTIKEQTLPLDIAFAGIDWYFSNNESRHIRFYGPGEPTQEFAKMKRITEYAKQYANRGSEVNYHAPMLMAIELKKKMNPNASIVIITSTESERGSFGGISYAASKAAVHNMIKSLACNWGKNEHIRVNAVAAGWIGGEMDTDGPFEVSINITPLGRLGKAEEVANSVYFLLSDNASFVNAQVLYVDGGYLAVDDIAKYEFEESKNND